VVAEIVEGGCIPRTKVAVVVGKGIGRFFQVIGSLGAVVRLTHLLLGFGGGGVGDLGAAQRRLLIDGAAAAAGAGAADCSYVGVLLCFFLAAVLIRVLT